MATGSSQEPSVAELRRDADRTRAHLTGTVEELRSQVADTATHVREAVSPATIKRRWALARAWLFRELSGAAP